jgi:hypothetical protein
MTAAGVRELAESLARDALDVDDVIARVGPAVADSGIPLPIELAPVDAGGARTRRWVARANPRRQHHASTRSIVDSSGRLNAAQSFAVKSACNARERTPDKPGLVELSIKTDRHRLALESRTSRSLPLSMVVNNAAIHSRAACARTARTRRGCNLPVDCARPRRATLAAIRFPV